jgi:hypothetical protein
LRAHHVQSPRARAKEIYCHYYFNDRNFYIHFTLNAESPISQKLPRNFATRDFCILSFVVVRAPREFHPAKLGKFLLCCRFVLR